MGHIGSKLQKQGVLIVLFTLVLINAGCDERFDNPAVNPSDGEMVEVTLNIGFADESDAVALPAAITTRQVVVSNNKEAFEVQLVPATQTKVATTSHPDQLYNLEVYQYDSSESYLTCTSTQTIAQGTSLNVSLDSRTSKLLIITRGEDASIDAFTGCKSLSEVRKLIAKAATIQAIGVENGTNINNMPYLLYLPKVEIKEGKLISPDQTDVRLLLKRLAVGVRIDWTFSDNMKNDGYALKEVRLMQVPADYRILPETETEAPYGEMYPTSVSNFIDGFRLKGDELSTTTSQTFWMPANARGTRSDINSPTQRSKEKAHSAATYVEFVVDNATKSERLLYRAYLGCNATSDFNLKENMNYYWKVNINNANYTTDSRIQLLDQTPVKSDNLQPTSNCFMMRPGTNICFNPYRHEAGTDGWNTELTTSGTTIQTDKDITSVKVLWQTKDAGTSGDLVMGYVIDDTNHENLVNLTDGDKINEARIHVKVPVTNGGNAVIAAYHNNTIVWSWHIWISDYVPVGLSGDITSANRSTAIETAQNATRGGMVQVYGGISWTDPSGAFYKKVIMDRNLGATRGGIQTNQLDGVRTFGLLYQGGRKDPFFCSADGTANETKTIYDGYGQEIAIEKKMLTSNMTEYQNTIENPLTYYCTTSSNENSLFNKNTYSWGTDAGSKTIYDPCPKGWRVPSNVNGGTKDAKQCMMAGFGSSANNWVPENLSPTDNDQLKYYDGKTLNLFNTGTVASSSFVGAGFVYTGGTKETMSLDQISSKSAFFPGVSLREVTSGNYRDKEGTVSIKNNTVYLWSSSSATNNCFYIYQFQSSKLYFQHTISRGFGFSVRCIQE
ncbi:DUF4906 domain-containing protein [uncultured Parabacteroides sp.]|uniref:DUF4906 domain-containing protein n=1 Tax=uncultured Parabacteroides sp. TaxID=512312 RepID=UPI00259B2C71|nr:DUF4906 domain-containing protein [uncultured Parabacteroides sp.]